jgi:hypothetical protein
MSSTTIAGYLVFFSCLFTGYIMISCMGDIKTPERFVRTNFHFGKENWFENKKFKQNFYKLSFKKNKKI